MVNFKALVGLQQTRITLILQVMVYVESHCHGLRRIFDFRAFRQFSESKNLFTVCDSKEIATVVPPSQ